MSSVTTAVLDRPETVPARPMPWVRGPAWDATWMLSALWLAPLVLWLSSGPGDPRYGPLDSLFLLLTAGLWLAHRVGSTWLAYLTTAYRPLVRAEPVRFVMVPIALVVFCFALLLPPDEALPWTRGERVVGLVIVDYVLVSYHFATQHFGALSLYRVRAGRSRAPGQRRLDRLYALAVGGLLVVVAEVVAGTVYYVDVWIDPWLDPGAVAAAAGTVRTIATVLVGGFAMTMLAAEACSARPSLPRSAYILGLAAMVIAAFQVADPFVFVVLWSAQHWIVATGIASLVASGEPSDSRPGWRRALHAVNRRPWAFVLVLGGISVLSLPLFEVEAIDPDGPFYAERIFGAFAQTLRTSAWLPALLALGFSTALIHYWLDRAVYRLSDARVREAARGLLAGAGEPR
jgi:hypothetical protein